MTKTPDSDEAVLNLGLRAVARGAEVAMTWFRSPDLVASTKRRPGDVVTQADLAVQEVIRSELLTARPTDGFVGEEADAIGGSSAVRWILDPIDSTANFARGIPIFSISLAAEVNGEVRVGIVSCPPLGEVISASRSTEVLLNGEAVRERVVPDVAAAMLVIGWGPGEPGRHGVIADALIPLVGKVRSPGSPALGLAWTAIGRFDAAYYEMDFSEWDVAAGILLCKRAGLEVFGPTEGNGNGMRRLMVAPGSFPSQFSNAVPK